MTNGISLNGFLKTWWGIFPVCVGLLALMLFAFLSACYLTIEAETAALQDDFRSRGLAAWVASVFMALVTFLMAGASALYKRWFALARIAVAIQVSLILLGWGLAQCPYIIRPNITISSSQAPNNVPIALLSAAAGGAVILIPSLSLLLYIFKRRKSCPPAHRDTTMMTMTNESSL